MRHYPTQDNCAVNRKPSVLVTGGAGYIGSYVAFALLDAGWPVSVIDNLSTGVRCAVPEGASLFEGDIAGSELLANIIIAQSIGAVMHFAGSIIVPESVTDPLKYHHNNTGKSRALIEAAVAGGVPHFLFSSSAAAMAPLQSRQSPKNARKSRSILMACRS